MIGTTRLKENKNVLLPKNPVAGWAAICGAHRSSLDCLLDAPQVQFTTSGRAAILHALIRLGVGVGDRVLVPTYHCPSMVAPIVALGAQPLFYPVTESGGVDLAVVRGWLDEMRPRAIIAAHFFGLPQPMAALRALCDETGMALVEDCAHSLFGSSDGRPVGQWGDFAIGSLTKFLAVPEGGCLISNGGAVAPTNLEPRGIVDQIRAAVDVIEAGARYGRFQGINWLLSGVFRLKRFFMNNHSDALAVPEPPDDAGAPVAYAAGLMVFVGYRDDIKWSDEIRFNDTQDTFALCNALNQVWERRPRSVHYKVPMQVGLVLNFGLSRMKDGIVRIVNGLPEDSRSGEPLVL